MTTCDHGKLTTCDHGKLTTQTVGREKLLESERRVSRAVAMAQVQTMATDRISGPMQEQIKHLLEAGHSIRKVAQALGVSRQVVRKFGRDETRIENEMVAQVVSLPIMMESAKWAHPIWYLKYYLGVLPLVVTRLHSRWCSGPGLHSTAPSALRRSLRDRLRLRGRHLASYARF